MQINQLRCFDTSFLINWYGFKIALLHSPSSLVSERIQENHVKLREKIARPFDENPEAFYVIIIILFLFAFAQTSSLKTKKKK